MYKKFAAHTAAKKMVIFLTVFLVAGVLMGMQVANQHDNVFLQGPGGDLTPVQLAQKQSQQGGSGTIQATMQSASFYGEVDEEQVDGDRKVNIGELAEIWESREKDDSSSDERDRDRDTSSQVKKETGFIYLSEIPLSKDLQKYTYDLCQDKGLEYETVLALMWRESRFQIEAVNTNTNGTQDSGIMQINDVNRGWIEKELGIVDLMDPELNIQAGTTMLTKMKAKYGIHYALMAYQYGEVGMLSKVEEGITTSRDLELLYSRREYYRELVEQTRAMV